MLTHFQSESLKPSDHFGGPRCRWLNNIKIYAADQVINIIATSKRVQDVVPLSIFLGEFHPQSTKCRRDLGDSQLLN